MMNTSFRRRLLASTLFASATLFAGAAAAQVTQPVEASPEAQAEAAQDGDVIVTGSRIGRPDLETASPVNVVGQAELNFRQPGTAEELLRDLPSVRPAIGPGVNNGSGGAATIDLRGIGETRTLVLVDGRRVTPFGLDGVVDLNTVPVGLLERVDIVTGGASTVYGADAVAGVVNFITKRNFSGIDATANYRISERGDTARFRGDLIVGGNFADDRGNAVLAIGYTKSDPLLHTQRNISERPISSVTGLFQGATAAQVTIFGSPTNGALGLPAGANLGAVVNPTTGLLQTATPADTYNTNIGTYFQTPLNRLNAFATARYEVTDGIEAYGSATFTRNIVTLQLASSGTFGNTYQLPLNNPFLPAGIRNQICNADTNATLAGVQPLVTPANCAAAAAAPGGPGTAGYLEVPVIAQRRITEFGPRVQEVESRQFQIQAGVRGDLGMGLKYDLSGQYGETTQNQLRGNWGSFSKVQQALRSFRNTAGTNVCSNTVNGCVPLNLFGPNGSITADQLAFIDLDAIINRKVTLGVITGSVAGDLFGLTSPFSESPIGFAVGGEYRRITAASQPDNPSQIQGEVLGTGARTPPDFGEYDVKEVFGEIIVPLVSDVPFFYRLQAEGGIRYSDYSTTGTSTTWKAGGAWEPFQGFKFRGMYQRAVRSPNIGELFQSPVQGLGNLTTDPCQGAVSTAVGALCVATGAPPSTIGSIPSPTSTQINVTTSGNPNLDVERARTYTLGGVFAPAEFLPGFSLTVDYFNILVKDAISAPAQADILGGCYSAALNPSFTDNAFCDLIQRNPLNGSLNGAGETPGVILASSNLGVIKTAGIDFGVNQRVPLSELGLKGDPGTISFGFNATWLDYYRFQGTPNAINRECTGYYSAGGCTNPRAEWKWNGRVTYAQDKFDISLLWTHVSPVILEPFLATRIAGNVPQPGGPNPNLTFPATPLNFVLDGINYTNQPTGGIQPAFRSIDAYDYFDLAIRFLPTENFELSVTVDNLFDKDPPLVGSGVGGTAFNSGNTFPTIYDPIGRAYTIGARLKF